jgi:hypothetical protein
MATKPKMIKVCLTNQGEDTETPWAHDLGPVSGGGRKVRLVNVPFLHAKPTWGDTIVVKPTEDGLPTWDRDGVPWKKIGTRIFADGGHWAMIVDYRPHDDTSGNDAFMALARACAEYDIVCEGAWGPRDDDPGRAYLAVPVALTDVSVMANLRGESLPCDLIQIHPTPAKAKPAGKARPAAKRKAPKKSAASRPAAKKRARS